ncbi:DegT/DnrJ/EryC1/StrS family aminotransferase [Polynucleobacter sp. JS-Mosq-20-D10]|uniref:DegT/DnrJ/EryC1/StrS family aminotransferase n=1 Tax=Polynucleobacter sp. JS-Mosq-20-D10 TaxID=2576922 RepID=UPI001BFE44F7|nr:DegT/DnrJ/EryC1/StrS family aminotransferase [Polynucleobacter sp. JS-Mosq-20-D10]QWE00782.1 DegT/DnrJ/EryC1/StrS family aminotransferase [Polynucleobacter sp. JS-Mosq-20-D10]
MKWILKPRFKPFLNYKEWKKIFRLNSDAVYQFEKKFAKKFKAVDAVTFPYGRSAQWAFFNAIGLVNSEVLMPSYTCSVVAHAVTLSGNTPVFVDINLNDYNMDLNELEKLVSVKTKAIIATHTFGYPQDLDRLEDIVKKSEIRFGHKIWLIQDCCHCFGAEWNGRMIGTSGDVAVYALNISKIMTSIFGGMLTFQNQDLANIVRDWRDNNYKKTGFLKEIKRRLYFILVCIAFSKYLYFVTWWLQEKTNILNKYTKAFHLDNKIHFPVDYLDHMTNIEAAIGLVQLDKYDQIIDYRRKKVNFYQESLSKNPSWILGPIIQGATYSHYPIRVSNRDAVLKEYINHGVQLGNLIQYSIPNLPEYSHYKGDFKNSTLASSSLINFPVTK